VADAALAGLPRLVRAFDEVRVRGTAAVGIGVAAAGWWMIVWLLDQPVSALRTLLGAAAVGVPTLLLAARASARRLDAASRVGPPPRPSLYETAADARERRTRLAGIVVLGVIVLVMFDRLTGGGGEMAGLVAGLFIATGIVDLMEARTWERLEREHPGGLYMLVRPHALMAHMGAGEVYERPRGDRVDEPEPSPFDL
jgi:heme A synthase